MPVTEKKYPDWVQKYRSKGTTVKKKGDSYYLYKRTSRRIKGKKYPQPVDTYIGVITPEGVIQSNKRKVSLTNAEVWEYGFSKAVWELCPDDWESDFRYQFAAQSSSLSRRIYKKWGVGMAELHRLETIYLVCLDKNEIISKVNKEQQELLKKIQVSLEMC